MITHSPITLDDLTATSRRLAHELDSFLVRLDQFESSIEWTDDNEEFPSPFMRLLDRLVWMQGRIERCSDISPTAEVMEVSLAEILDEPQPPAPALALIVTNGVLVAA